MKKILWGGLLAAFLFCGKVLAADCARATGPYSDGDILYASAYESEWNNAMTCINARAQDTGDNFTGNVSFYSGADFNSYSDTGSTLQASIDGATGKAILGIPQAGFVDNCEISVSGSTLTISGDGGTSLSSTNPCIVAIKSNTAGRVQLVKFTANVTFTFGSSSDTDGNLFGITDANWSNAMPFFIGVIYNGTTPYFTISRVPHYVSGAASTALCQKGDTDCDAQFDAMILTTGLTLSSWVNLPITQVGWFQMTYATSGGAWTASTSIHTGFNQEYEKIGWTLPSGQMGATSGKYLSDDGGVAPVFSNNSITFYIDHSGKCTVWVNLWGDGGTDGSSSGSVLIAMPYKVSNQNAVFSSTYSGIFLIGPPGIVGYLGKGTVEYSSYAGVSYLDILIPTVSGTNLQNWLTVAGNTLFTNGARYIQGSIIYPTIE